MRAFRCSNCDQLLFFENSQCLNCGSQLGFVPSTLQLVRMDDRPELPRCANTFVARCNWLVEREGEDLCLSCRTTKVRPADDDPAGLEQYAEAESAKRRVLYQLLDIGLPVNDDTLDFELKNSDVEAVMTGHADGVVTLDLAEADDAQRAQRRNDLGEPYRTLVGHFRHELGHYYQPIVLTNERDWERCRAVFGDERQSYQDALDRHYANGAPADWPDRFVSAYATMHPWEDWAETFAHYLHIRDTLQTAANFGLQIVGPSPMIGDDEFESYPDEANAHRSFDAMWQNWLPLTYALNQINRSMGRLDLYPFALSQPAVDKLAFMHTLVNAATKPWNIEATREAAVTAWEGDSPEDAPVNDTPADPAAGAPANPAIGAPAPGAGA
ncbi:MAG: putative zinc-binding metallopeptidase [Solirubrobacteraceae bacterium]|nr:putative zinc-binding metallopeptidase [Solirubrobacteraceae bacterium]